MFPLCQELSFTPRGPSLARGINGYQLHCSVLTGKWGGGGAERGEIIQVAWTYHMTLLRTTF